MEKQPIHIECSYAENGDIQQILHHSFLLYLDRTLAEPTDKPYNQHDEWPLISGGKTCTWK